ncbi:MAG: chromate transporter [Paludibacter sp.]|nr:chromate transporter [Bacteroidales bacterium]MCM1068493.1 chromate transporter [Prevotella sp.]MCM1353447.1 chromate transporter [Bacteroides sp.]MCM1442608.1 chromate transporter [Muribaculum sp.]MCM1481453.1 chromate transporter [Paludibacter sp.]
MREQLRIYRQLFWTFLKIGAFTLGGGYAMIPLVQREVVDRQHWIEEEEFLNMLALAQSAPGVMAVNTAIFIGYKIRGWKGVIVTTLGSILPSFVIILLIATVFMRFKEYPAVEAIFRGIRPAVVALIAAPLYKMAKTAKITWLTAIIPVAAALLIRFLHLSPIWVILITIVAGILYAKMKEKNNQ